VARAWETLETVATRDGALALRRRGDDEWLIQLDGRVLMNSHASRSEVALGRVGAEAVARRAAPRVLVGGLGMACTLRACLDALPADAALVVAELHPAVAAWCREGPLAALSSHAAADPRVRIEIADVSDVIAAAAAPGAARFDAILLDLYEGPHARTPRDDPHYGEAALAALRTALRPRGVVALWSEDPNAAFEKHFAKAGFRVRALRPGHGGRRHVVYLGERVG
jgi:spermidine synthase